MVIGKTLWVIISTRHSFPPFREKMKSSKAWQAPNWTIPGVAGCYLAAPAPTSAAPPAVSPRDPSPHVTTGWKGAHPPHSHHPVHVTAFWVFNPYSGSFSGHKHEPSLEEWGPRDSPGPSEHCRHSTVYWKRKKCPAKVNIKLNSGIYAGVWGLILSIISMEANFQSNNTAKVQAKENELK